MNDAILDRLEEGRDKLGGFGEPVWSQAMLQYKLHLSRIAELEAENARLRNELADWDERTDGFTREALSEEPDDIDANKPPMKLGNKVSEEPAK